MSAFATPIEPATRMTPEDFLDWEGKQERKWEFDGILPVAMVGGTAAHATIQGNIITSLNNRLRGQRCRPYGPETMVATGEGRYRYPDVVITCATLRPDERLVAEPVVLFEVLSDSTFRTDWTAKLFEYRSILTVQRYVLVEQDQALLTVVTRTPTGWSLDMLRADRTLELPEIGIEVPVAEFYLDVQLAPLPE